MNNSSFSRRPNVRQRSGFRTRNQSYTSQRKTKRAAVAIDYRKFINRAVAPAEEQAYIPQHTFADFAMSGALKRNISEKGYSTPTAIQDQAIPHILAGSDVVGLANTGTGKTAAFVLPIINRLLSLPPQATVLIMAPTRELALQIDEEFRSFARGLRLYSTLCVGGVNIQRQIFALSRRPQVVIGTPGRLKDLVNRQVLKLSTAAIVVLDEADQMLDMGFIRDIRFLLAQLPTQRQSLCFSATMTPEIEQLLGEFLQEPAVVSVRTRETSDHVEQDIIKAESKEHKLTLLYELLGKPEFEKVLIFGETKWGVQRLAEHLTKGGVAAEAIHGNKSQPQRQRALHAFKQDKVRVLVATDVAARGLDIPNVTHVINFDQPASYQDYVHRIGRTGRGGKRGQALTFVSGR